MNSLSSALSSIRRSPYQALAAILTMTVTFAVAFCLSFFFSGAHIVLNYYETRPQIIAFFQLDASQEKVTAAQKNMEAKDYVSEVHITSKEEALKLYSQEFEESPLLLELVTADILPASIEVSAKNIQSLSKIKTDLEGTDGVEDVKYQENVVDTLQAWTQNARLIGIGASVVLAVVSFLVMMVIIGMRVSMQKRAISIMRLLGATKWYVKRPFMLEGMVYGILGALLGWGVSIGVLIYITPWVQNFLTGINLFPIPLEFFAIQLGAGLLVGLSLGGFAGQVAADRLIKN